MDDLANSLSARLKLASSEPSAGSNQVVVVQEVASCQQHISAILDHGEPVAVDYEGVNLCRHGELCLMQLAPREGPVLLIDVTTMGADAFSEGQLKDLLESKTLLKLCYDCRADSDALYHLYGVHPQNLYDMQVTYCTKRDQDGGRRDPYVKGLAHALSACPGIPFQKKMELDSIKMKGVKLFAPEKGGSYDVWKARPLDPALVKYAAADVAYLHSMYEAWAHIVPAHMMQSITSARTRGAISSRAAAKGKHMAIKDFRTI